MGPKQFDVQIFDGEEENFDYFEDNAKDVLERMYDYVMKNIKWEFAQRDRRSWVMRSSKKSKHCKELHLTKTVNLFPFIINVPYP